MPKIHGDKHHLIPSSRIREMWGIFSVKILKIIKKTRLSWKNKRKKSVGKHRAWHFLFNNRLPCEAINTIETGRIRRRYDIEGKRLSQENIDKLKTMEEKWQELFGNETLENQAMKIIKKYWTPRGSKRKSLCFQFKECFQFHNPKKICPLIGLRLDKKGELIKIDLRRETVSSPFLL